MSSRTLEEALKVLNADIPRSAVRERNESGMTLSYVDGFYVISKLNEAFGLSWDYQIINLQVENEGQNAKGRLVASAEAMVRLTVRADGVYLMREDVGYGHGQSTSFGRAKESAGKEAVTDALKRAARTLGNAMGLALYDHTQAHVSDDAPAPKKGRKKKAEPAPVEPAMSMEAARKAVADAASIEDLRAIVGDLKTLAGHAEYATLQNEYRAKKNALTSPGGTNE